MMRDDAAPATKGDLQQFVENIQHLIGDMEHHVGQRMDTMEQRMDTMEQRITKEAEETRRHFDVVAENIKHDFQGAFHDKLEQHEDRIVRLEAHVSLA